MSKSIPKITLHIIYLSVNNNKANSITSRNILGFADLIGIGHLKQLTTALNDIILKIYIKKEFKKKMANTTSNNKIVVPEARAAMDRFKMEAASEVGVNLKDGYNGHLTSREAGSIGGQMVKKMIESYENSLK